MDGAHTFLVPMASLKMKHLLVLTYKLYPAVLQDLCTQRGVHQLKSDGTPVHIVKLTQYPPTSTLDVYLILVQGRSLSMSGT